MRPLALIAVAALLVGAALGLGEIAAPEWRNHAGTSRDSNHPCRVDRSTGATFYQPGAPVVLGGDAAAGWFATQLGLIDLGRCRRAAGRPR